MKQPYRALAFTTCLFFAHPTLAATLTMLQFGSFETRAEAEKRLSEVSTKYNKSLGALPTSIREVKLPPDNLTVYRTQAGPVENRTTAQNICTNLTKNGDECYIVQTAMVAQAEGTPVAAAPATAPAAPSLLTPSPAAPEAPVADAPDVTSKLSTLKETETQPATTGLMALSGAKPVDLSAEAAAPEMKDALDQAAAAQTSTAQSVEQATATPAPESHRSFWSWLNPFSDSKPKEPTPMMADAAPMRKAPLENPSEQAFSAPMEEVKPVEMAAAPVMEPAPAPEPVMAVAPVEIATAPAVVVPPAAPVITTMAAAPMAATVISEPAPLPPPAPLSAPMQQMHMTSAPAPEPIPTAPMNVLAPEPVMVNTLPAAGQVSVEEARRVPLTESNSPTGAMRVQEMTPPPAIPLQPDASLSPSSTDHEKSVWAQIGPFPDNSAAMDFWSDYRAAHPDFPVVRVRVVTPFQMQVRGEGQSWLRVGPVMTKRFINALCGSLVTPGKPSALTCGVVTDMGIFPSARNRQNVMKRSRYRR